jgi:hypothetical protein
MRPSYRLAPCSASDRGSKGWLSYEGRYGHFNFLAGVTLSFWKAIWVQEKCCGFWFLTYIIPRIAANFTSNTPLNTEEPSLLSLSLIKNCTLFSLYSFFTYSDNIRVYPEVSGLAACSENCKWCNCIAILWATLVSFAAITLCVSSQRVFIVGCLLWPGNKNSPTVTHACRKRRLKWVATLPLGDINTEVWSTGMGVGVGLATLPRKKENC